MIRASVAIVTYGRSAVLVATIRNVLTALSSDDELIVVDQTLDYPPEIAAELAHLASLPQVRFLTQREPRTTLARNTAARVARSEFIIYVDDDVEVSPGFVEQHLAYYDDPRVGAVAGHCIVHGRRLAAGTGPYLRRAFGANMSFRRGALIAVGGFDENIPGGWREESECVGRIADAGWLVVNGERCALVHLEAIEGGDGTRGHSDASYRRYYHNITYVLLKQPFYRALLSAPRTYAGTFRHRYPGHRRFWTRQFFVDVLLQGVREGWSTSRHPRRGPFLVA